MRMIVVKTGTDLQSLGSRLVGNVGDTQALLHRVEQLNPHIDPRRIAEGTVLFVPDVPGLVETQTTSIGGQAFDAFARQVEAQVESVAAQVRKGYADMASERTDVTTVLKSAAVRKQLDADPDLKPQVEAANAVFKNDLQHAKDAEATLKALQGGVTSELAMLARLLA